MARVDGEEILTVNAALGSRGPVHEGWWAEMPSVAPPRDCQPRELPDERNQGTIADSIEMRLAAGRHVNELATRMGDLDLTQAPLAIFGDDVPFGISQAIGRRAGGNSLDNTIRIAHRHPTDWVPADIRVHAMHDGSGHGLVHLWSEDGALLGTASQSTIVRRWKEERP